MQTIKNTCYFSSANRRTRNSTPGSWANHNAVRRRFYARGSISDSFPYMPAKARWPRISSPLSSTNKKQLPWRKMYRGCCGPSNFLPNFEIPQNSLRSSGIKTDNFRLFHILIGGSIPGHYLTESFNTLASL